MEGISSNEATSFWFYQCGHAVFISHLKNVLLMDSHLMGEAFFVRSRVELLIKKLSTRMESQSYKKTCKARGRKQVITPFKTSNHNVSKKIGDGRISAPKIYIRMKSFGFIQFTRPSCVKTSIIGFLRLWIFSQTCQYVVLTKFPPSEKSYDHLQTLTLLKPKLFYDWVKLSR